MEIKIGTKQVLRVLLVIAWIIFIGLCIEAGGFLFNAIYSLVKPGAVGKLWKQIDLSALLQHDRSLFFSITFIMTIAAVMKALIFYTIIKISYKKQLNVMQPFKDEVRRFISNVAYLSLGTGFFCWWGEKYTEWLVKQGVEMPGIQYMRLAGADVWLFMGVTLLVVAQLFKRGVEMQTENELTV